jgi:uncharacterized protein with PIN domain
VDRPQAAGVGARGLNAPADTRFAADAMLGRLARWLRALGYDTSYDATLADPVLVAQANEEGRVLLTRDRLLLRELRPLRAHEVRQDDPLAQLRDLVHALDLAAGGPRELFTRCLLCNCELLDMAPGEAKPLLPPGVLGTVGRVRRCPACARLYWDGSHVRRMRAALERTLPREFLTPA